nr:integrase, catalytic region, zinc finger, CCHC-type, peptidase aspartic, catalytic [Tanacetum cinerariifolium]
MLLEGFELTKKDQDSQLYDDFEHFRQNQGETIHAYYVRFAKLINDMRNIKMTMSRMQLNSKFVNNMLPEWGRLNRGQGNNPRGGGVAGYEGAQNRVGNVNPDKMLLMQAQENGVALDEEQLLFLAGGQDNAIDEDVNEQPNSNYFKDKMLLMQAQENGVALDEEQLLFLADHVYDEAGPSYDLNILSEVHDLDHYQDAVCEHHEELEMHDNIQPNHVVDSHANYTSDSNMIPYDQYVKDSAVPGVQRNVSSIPNDAYMMIYNDMYEPYAQSVSKTSRNTVVDNSLTAELATYKEQVELYERRVRFELTESEQKIDEQLRIVISDRNFKEEI